MKMKQTTEQFDMLDEKQAPVARGEMREVWERWGDELIPFHPTNASVELDIEVELVS